MQITDYLGQYANTLANAASEALAEHAQGTSTAAQDLVSALTEQLQEGTVFEGSIHSIEGSKVLLGLSNGQTIAAKLDSGVNLMLGQSVFFQVKSNDGKMIAIKPYTGQLFNPTIQKALHAAGMEMTKETMDMVNRMMQEGMPIDKHSLASMRQILMQNPHISMNTAIMMNKLGIPVNDSMAAQFENYINDRHSVLGQMEQVMDGLPSVFAKAASASGILQLNQQVLAILHAAGEASADGSLAGMRQEEGGAASGAPGSATGQAGGGAADMPGGVPAQGGSISAGQAAVLWAAQETAGAGGVPGQEDGVANGQEAGTAGSQEAAGAGRTADGQEAAAGRSQEAVAGRSQEAAAGAVESAGSQAAAGAGRKQAALQGADAAASQAAEQEGSKGGQRQISDLLNRHQMFDLEAQLKAVFPKAEHLKLNGQLTANEFLEALARQLAEQQPSDKEALSKLFSGKGYHTLLKDVMEQQWMLRPEDLKSEHKVEELYQRLNRQMGQMEQLAKQAGMDTSQFSQSAAQVRDNIEFMHQINQAYTYVQIPLKMANQNAHSDLYVYTNKRNLRKKGGELSAFLHLELENLGTTDVSIKMLDKNVSTKFYLEDDASYGLVEKHLPQLKERLSKLGYHCSVSVENREEKVDFVQDFLQKNQPAGHTAARGMLQRYSFDVRA